MPLLHIVIFKFAPDASKILIDDICTRMLALRRECVQPETKENYIVSLEGGKDVSLEGKHKGYTHIFVVTFANETDRNYYVRQDEAHLRYSRSLQGTGTEVMVVDFQDGQF